MKPRVLFIGDVNLDIQMTGLVSPLRVDREVFCDGFQRSIGGSTAITAAAYSYLGGEAEFCGLVGDDQDGRFVAEELRKTGLDLRLLRYTSEVPTGVTVNLVEQATRTQVTYLGSLGLTDEVELALRELPRFTHIHVSGPYGTPLFLPNIKELLAAAREMGLSTSLDTQWGGDAQWHLLESWFPYLTWLFVNDAEACSITGKQSARDALLILSQRTSFPIVKQGALGVLFKEGRIPSPEVALVDSTGAGDSFAAGFLYALLEEKLAVQEALAFAAAAGALACTYAGGVNSILSRDNVQSLLEKRPLGSKNNQKQA
jgi:sugar/nucleoside kinase (ribokinase family)